MGRKYYINPETGEKIYIRDKAPNMSQYRKAADQDTIDSELRGDLTQKITAPENPVAGKILKVLAVNEDGSFVCEWADGGAVDDVQVNGTSIVTDGVASIPTINKDSKNTYGLVKIDTPSAHGFAFKAVNSADNTNCLYIAKVSAASINRRLNAGANGYGAITTDTLDIAVKAAMCDPIGSTSSNPAWTPEEQAAAQQRLGILSSEEVLF